MANASTDRTQEQERRLQAIRVRSEDTCCFWKKNGMSQVNMRRCFYCEHYIPCSDDGRSGVCGYKVSTQR